jgi:hypothetical protein
MEIKARATALVAKMRKRLLHVIGPDTAKTSW